MVLLFDAAGIPIAYDTARYRYGVDGRAFGPGWRDDVEAVELPQNVADAAESIVILHYWDPKADWIGNVIIGLRLAAEVIGTILGWRAAGEPVNAGGEGF
jgi:hypothetical protein